MMKGMLKRALGVVTAAAMAVTGLGVAAGTASAASGNSNVITITGDVAGRTFSAYQLGTYAHAVKDTSTDCIATVDLEQNTSDWGGIAYGQETLQGIAELVEKVVGVDFDANHTEYKNHELAYLTSNSSAEQQRNFASAMAAATTKPSDQGKYATATADEDATQVRLGGLAEGWYLVTDDSGSPLLVSTTITADGSDRDCMVQGTAKLGTAAAKPNSVPGTKTVDENNVSVGQSVTYTLTGKVPNTTGETSHIYRFIDTPGVGLTVNPSSVQVTVDGISDTLLPAYSVSSAVKFEGNATNPAEITSVNSSVNQLIVDLSDWVMGAQAQSHIGATITVTYTATINEDILSEDELGGKVSNNMVLQSGNTYDMPNETTVQTYGFAFTKIDADHHALDGAAFTVQQGSASGLYLNGSGTDDDPYTFTSTSQKYTGTNGVFEFNGLNAGTYYVTETTVPDGYMQSVKAAFTVNISEASGAPTFTETGGALGLGLVNGNGTVSDSAGTSSSGATVLNVTSVIELPATGAAGIAMFAVVAVLIAGAAVVMYGRSRKAAAELRA